MGMEFDFEVDCELCETAELFGAAGVCSEDNSTCICPDGYTGRDDWLLYPSCHVNEELAFGIHVVMLCLVVAGLVSSALCVVILLRRWGFAVGNFKMNSYVQDVPNHVSSISQQLEPKGTTISRELRIMAIRSRRAQRRALRTKMLRRDTIIANILFFIFCLSSLVYQIPFLTKRSDGERVSMRDGTPWHQLSFSVALTGILSALYLMLLTWYNTLPDVKAFGNLFQMNPWFIRFPNFVKTVSAVMITFSIIYPFVFITLIPSMDESFYPTMVLSFNLVALFYVGVFGILQWVVISSVMKTFTHAASSLEFLSVGDMESGLNRRHKILKEAHFTSRVFRALGSVIMIFCVGLGSASLGIGQKPQYLYLSLVSVGPYLCAIVFPLGILMKTNGGLKPLPTQYEDDATSQLRSEIQGSAYI